MKPRVAALLSGLLFGAGLVVAGMTSPAKVTAFLDLFGRWDPSLALVMVGAILVHAALLRPILRLRHPLFATRFSVPQKTTIDGRLVAGAALFGVGWGLGGVCPGPGVVSAAAGSGSAIVFVIAMGAGVLLQRRLFPVRP